jgi:hypothetical protein
MYSENSPETSAACAWSGGDASVALLIEEWEGRGEWRDPWGKASEVHHRTK